MLKLMCVADREMMTYVLNNVDICWTCVLCWWKWSTLFVCRNPLFLSRWYAGNLVHQTVFRSVYLYVRLPLLVKTCEPNTIKTLAVFPHQQPSAQCQTWGDVCHCMPLMLDFLNRKFKRKGCCGKKTLTKITPPVNHPLSFVNHLAWS